MFARLFSRATMSAVTSTRTHVHACRSGHGRAALVAGLLGLSTLIAPTSQAAITGEPRPAVSSATTITRVTGVAAITSEASLARLFTASRLRKEWFAPVFLAQISVAQIQQVVDAVKAKVGAYQSIAAHADGSYAVTFTGGAVQAQIHLDGQGRIDGLLFTSIQQTHVSRGAALAQLSRLPGHVSLLVVSNGATVLSLDPDRALAVGSTFKLAVLAAIQNRIRAGQLHWTDMIALRNEDKSLPSGTLQTRPAGSRYSVSDLAAGMISISDNTAANVLIRVAGRAAIDPLIPVRDRPILTTRELFILKDPANRDLTRRYLAASAPSQRLAVLDAVDRRPLPSLRVLGPLLARGPVVPHIEYFFTARELCGLMGRVSRLPQMSLNPGPGVANRSDWTRVAFKGGSESGVLNLTTEVVAHSGVTYCVSATWNAGRLLDDLRFFSLYGSILESYK